MEGKDIFLTRICLLKVLHNAGNSCSRLKQNAKNVFLELFICYLNMKSTQLLVDNYNYHNYTTLPLLLYLHIVFDVYQDI